MYINEVIIKGNIEGEISIIEFLNGIWQFGILNRYKFELANDGYIQLVSEALAADKISGISHYSDVISEIESEFADL